MTPTYSCGVKEAALRGLFPQQVNRMLEEGLRRFNHKLPGFADADAVMTGAETRTSSPGADHPQPGELAGRWG